jgi:2-polyprenyl-3-methyl-5-hydroxy-6-metoxy-1,4-benzoquinol methylase
MFALFLSPAMNSDAPRFRPHAIQWTPEKVRRFWDHSMAGMTDIYFAKMVGHSIVRYVSNKIPLGTALDLGCGTGGLIDHLLASGTSVYGSDQSPEAVAAVNVRFAASSGFKGAFVGTASIPPVDSVFMLEVIEHMDDATLASAIASATKLIKRGGHLILTTPNQERLAASERICPDCGCTFHTMQHVRSWSATTLEAHMSVAGFRTICCEPTLFSAHKGAKAIADRLRFRHRHKPHLVYIGQAVH